LVTEHLLRQLYLEEKLSQRKIAEKLGLSAVYVGRLLRYYGISCGKEPPNLRRVDLSPSPELAYVLGAVLGDGSAFGVKRGYAIVLRATDYEFVEFFNENLSKLLKREKLYPVRVIRREGVKPIYEVQGYSKVLSAFILKGSRDQIENVVSKYPREFISGIFDSEGCVYIKWEGNRLEKKVFISNSDHGLLELCASILAKLGIEGHIYIDKQAKGRTSFIRKHPVITKKDCYKLQFRSKKAITSFAKKIEIHVKRKREKLNLLLREMDKINEPKQIKRTLTPDVLWELYVEKQLTARAIAKMFGCCRQYVQNLLKEYNIPTRKGGPVPSPRHLLRSTWGKIILKELYLNRKYSINKLAEKFNCSRQLIRKILTEEKLKSRGRLPSETTTLR
jgi:intein-encoded DNA endonuclease-like protein/predicted DNA-binding protein YlxM (UPF0122 family)